MALTISKVKRYYDRFGNKLDSQGFYEDPPIERLIEHAAFDQAASVVELGCGTGRLAARLLSSHLPVHSTYLGVDVSDTMIALARDRLLPFAGRAEVKLSPGGTEIPLNNKSVDRFVTTYVLDLLPEKEIGEVFDEALRVLVPGGLLCCASLTKGNDIGSKIVAGIWRLVYGLFPSLVGGCRPIRLAALLDLSRWDLLFREVLTPYGVPSETVVAQKKR